MWNPSVQISISYIFFKVMSDDNCLDASQPDGPVKLVRCHGMGGNQAWVYNKLDKTLRHINTARYKHFLSITFTNGEDIRIKIRLKCPN